MWEIMQRGANYILWMRKDAEGNIEWAATSDLWEPTQAGVTTAKEAIERLRDDNI